MPYLDELVFAPAPAGWWVLFSGSGWGDGEPPYRVPMAGWITVRNPESGPTRIVPGWLDGAEVAYEVPHDEVIRVVGPGEDLDTPAIREWHAHHTRARP